MAAVRKTNVEMVTEIMEFSAQGALAEVFVMFALEQVSGEVATASLSPEAIAAWESRSPVRWAAWQAVAKDIQRQLQTQFAPSALEAR